MALSDTEQNELLKLARAINGRLQGVVRLESSVPSSWSSVDPKGQDPLPLVSLLAELSSAVQELRARPSTTQPIDYDQLADALLRRIAATA